MKPLIAPALVMSVYTLLTACGNPDERLDEYVFHEGPGFQLKVVRYYRNIPFNYLGEHAVVMCGSSSTANLPAKDGQDAGWRRLAAGGGQGTGSAQEAALGVKDDYVILDDHTLATTINVFNISFDACGHFIHWDPSRLPPAMIDPVEKPESCAPKGPADCRYYDFEGERAPDYEQIDVPGNGRVSFIVSSKTFRGVDSLRVKTANNGAVWHVDTVGLDYSGQSVDTDKLRSLPVSSLDQEMADTSLVTWLESLLPPRSMVIWPDALTTCGEDQVTGQQTSTAQCAEIHFNDIEGNSGTIYIGVDSEYEAGNASYQTGFYKSGDTTQPLTSLNGLHEKLAAGKQ